ncbi:hypothetical protein M5E06_31260 [Azospirillum sp. A1-3]|uniref:hypothetical protein n=1 Tax=Azospirillum sp. A1-3 TaxID=185874 RepID=UPI002076FCFD|nr:hypothetical protein [Azospirillum sp. A1-3]MCM8738595.1 hypothetical protein [Azospirillum sp. A1-3]
MANLEGKSRGQIHPRHRGRQLRRGDDEVVIGHGVMFTNDRYPQATNADGSPQSEQDWTLEQRHIKARASIGSNATIIAGSDHREVGAGRGGRCGDPRRA